MSQDRHAPLRAAMRQLLLDQAGTWDAPLRMYRLYGAADDPVFALLAEQHGGLGALFSLVHETGIPAEEHLLGLALSVEGWQAAPFEEFAARYPHLVAQLRGSAAQAWGRAPTEAELRDLWNVRLARHAQVSSLPRDLRQEVRSMTVVLRDGTMLLSVHVRDTDDVHTDMAGQIAGTVATALADVMAGRPPTLPAPTEDRGAQ